MKLCSLYSLLDLLIFAYFLPIVQGDVYAVEQDNDGVWYHQVLDAHWGIVDAEDDVLLDPSPFLNVVEFIPAIC